MATEDQVGLLEVEEVAAVPPKRRVGRRLALVAGGVACLVGSVAFISKSMGGNLRADTQELISESKAAYTATKNCYGFSGGTCSVSDCNKERGATCVNKVCVCEAGCAGADNVCYKGEKNAEVATKFRLKNVKYPKYAAYVPAKLGLGQMSTTNWNIANGGKDYFSLYKMPGNSSATPQFFLSSDAYPNYVARVAGTSGTALAAYALYTTSLADSKAPGDMAVSVCWDSTEEAIKIGNSAGTAWAYLRSTSKDIYGWGGDASGVGKEGAWQPDPAFTSKQIKMLPKC